MNGCATATSVSDRARALIWH